MLRVSCEELTYWCRESDSEEQQLKRALEVRISSAFNSCQTLLCEHVSIVVNILFAHTVAPPGEICLSL